MTASYSEQPMTEAELELWIAAERAMDEYRCEWFERRGGTREEGARVALAASDAVELVHPIADRFPDLDQKLGIWLDLLRSCPEIEKAWFGLAEYREDHRVKGRA